MCDVYDAVSACGTKLRFQSGNFDAKDTLCCTMQQNLLKFFISNDPEIMLI